MTWHVPDTVGVAYLADRLTPVQTASVEAHIESCPTCQGLMSDLVAASSAQLDLDRIWVEVVDDIDREPQGAGQRVAIRVGVPDHIVRLLASAPGLRWPWLAVVMISSLGTLGIALASKDPTVGRLPFLVLAPLLPLGGVILSYGPSSDPAHELAVASPYGSGRLTLVRAVAAATVTIPIVAVAGGLIPEIGWRATAWLAPALALSSATLAASRRVSLRAAAATVGAAWIALVVLASGWRPGVRWSALDHPDLAFAARFQPIYLGLALVFAGLVAAGARHDVPLARRIA